MTHRTRKQWRSTNPYEGGSMRQAHAKTVIIEEAKADIEELYAKMGRLKAKLAHMTDLDA